MPKTKDEIPETVSDEQKTTSIDSIALYPISKYEYKFLFKFEYPFHVENRTQDEIIVDEANYFINRNLYEHISYYNYERDMFEFPVEDVYRAINEAPDIDELRSLLRKHFHINNKDEIEIKRSEESESDDEYDYTEQDSAQAGDGVKEKAEEEEENW